MKKIAFCFLIYDIIECYELWYLFFKNVDISKYHIYIHYKENKTLPYFEQYKLSYCIPTKYADVSIIYAHNLLFAKAYYDGCDKIISLSQSCIPFKSFDHVYDFLTKDDYSHFNIAPQPTCFPRCNSLLQYYQREHIQKSSNWFILNRDMCRVIIEFDKNELYKQYSSVVSPEEHFFITLLFYHRLQDKIIMTPNLSNDATTFTNWEGMNYPFPSPHGLKNYTRISPEEIEYLTLKSKCLFGRKFRRECLYYFSNPLYLSSIQSSLTKTV
jgi:hypothetical protein